MPGRPARTPDGPVLVTGAAGFIGAHLVRRLVSLEGEVRAVDLHPPPSDLNGSGLTWWEGDFRDPVLLGKTLEGVDTVYHLASLHLTVRADEGAFEAVNVRGTERLVSACREAGVRRLVHTSSVGIYGHVEDPPASEGAPKRPSTPYERSKLEGERVLLRPGRRSGLDAIVVRPAWVYGPGCPRTAKLIRALRNRTFFYIGDGSNLRHPIHIEDMLAGYLRAASAPPSRAGKAYIIAGPRFLELREMVKEFARALEVPAPTFSVPAPVGRGLAAAAEIAFGLFRRDPPFSRRSLAFFQNDNAFDISAARRDLGFEPKVGLEEGIRRSLAAG